MTKNCRRATMHEPHPGAFMTLQRVPMNEPDGSVGFTLEQEVWLCPDCRIQAGAENAAALSRRQGRGVV